MCLSRNDGTFDDLMSCFRSEFTAYLASVHVLPSDDGILMPGDFENIHRVFSNIVSEPWFTPSSERREQFAAEIVDFYRQGITDPTALSDQCWAIARSRYGNGGSTG